jgi:hypothetical protein
VISISTSVYDLLRVAPPEIDWPAMAVMLRLGLFIGDRTAFRGIRLVPANATLTWTGGALEIDAPPRSVRSQALRRSQAIEGYVALVRDAVGRRPPPTPFAMPLSGGRDSRHILLELDRLGHRPEKVLTSQHYLPTSTVDCELARSVAQRLGVEHETLTLRRPAFAYHGIKNVLTDFSAFAHAWSIELARRLASYQTAYDGLNGGGLFGRPSPRRRRRFELFSSGKMTELARDLLTTEEASLRAVLADSFYRQIPYDLAEAALCEELLRYSGFPNPLQAFYCFNTVRRESALFSFGILNVPHMFCPLDDLDLVDFALALPAELTMDGSVQEEAIIREFPRFRDIPFDTHASSLGAGRVRWRRRLIADVVTACLSSRSCGIVDRRSVAFRGVRDLMRRDVGGAWWDPELAAFMVQLEGHLGRHTAPGPARDGPDGGCPGDRAEGSTVPGAHLGTAPTGH